MNEQETTFAIAFDPKLYSKKTLALILDKSQEWEVSPLEAQARLLDELAEKGEKAA